MEGVYERKEIEHQLSSSLEITSNARCQTGKSTHENYIVNSEEAEAFALQ
jgi:hypothetical protein